jgi:hypothetical protein
MRSLPRGATHIHACWSTAGWVSGDCRDPVRYSRSMGERANPAGCGERTRLRFSRIPIARCADRIRCSASARVLSSQSVQRATGSTHYRPMSPRRGSLGQAAQRVRRNSPVLYAMFARLPYAADRDLVSSGDVWKTPDPRAGICTPLFSVRRGAFMPITLRSTRPAWEFLTRQARAVPPLVVRSELCSEP